MAHIVSPSLLAADFANLQRDIEFVNSSDADWFHIDVMDGVFVPNISFGMPVIKAIAKHANKPLDVHLMIVDPDRYLEDFANLGSNILTVHVEACDHLHRTLAAIRELGMKAGVALNPHTPVESLGEVLHDFDLVCLMGVNPGFGGQTFIERTYEKVRKLREMGDHAGRNFHIEIDGGVTISNASALVEAGADVLVAGSSIFKAVNPGEATTALKNA
jgi:ribulose-phosphate 3-epimerase